MQTSPVLVLLSCVFLAGAEDSPLPSYIRPCASTDPKFNECVVERANAAIPTLVKGDSKHGVPVMDPLVLNEVELSRSEKKSALNLTMQNTKLYGLKKMKAIRANFDLKNGRLLLDHLHVPEIQVLGQYDMSGKLLLLPISGRGDINITLVDCGTLFSVNYHIDGGNYMVFTDPKTVLDCHRGYFKLDNLFNGDKLLGKQMNEFLNVNWRDVYKELSPGMTDAVSQAVKSMVSNLTKHVNFDVLFPETLP